MARGLGTSLGVAVTGLVYAIGHEGHVGLLASCLFLAGTSVAAAAVAAINSPSPFSRCRKRDWAQLRG
jgi:hypothetical protein